MLSKVKNIVLKSVVIILITIYTGEAKKDSCSLDGKCLLGNERNNKVVKGTDDTEMGIKIYRKNKVVTYYHDAVDFNGDGKKDEFEGKILGRVEFEIRINDFFIKGEGEEIESIRIIDIDKGDRFKEIVVFEAGPSDDPELTYYYYNGKEVILMGKIPIHYEKHDGQGNISGKIRAHILHTWYKKVNFKINKNRKIFQVKKDFYDMGQYVVELKKEIKLLKKIKGNEVAYILIPPQKIRLLKTDDKEWIYVENDKKQQGWLHWSGEYPYYEYFEGLCIAD